MSSELTPLKRPLDEGVSEPNGKGKLQKSVYFTSQNTSFKISPGSIVFRVLCPASKTGSVIGKGGNKISQIRQETGAKVRVEETIPGCNERVVVIAASGNENATSNDETKDADQETDDAEKPSLNAGEDLQIASSVQKALMLVFEIMVEGEPETNEGVEDETTTFSVRLLVLSSQVGCLLGKSGGVIKQMSSESGAQIRVLPRDKLPSCASSSDELVQISGEVSAVRKALESVSQHLLDQGNDCLSGSANKDPNPPQSGGREGGSGRFGPFNDMLTYRLICPDEKVGGVIGKGGAIVKALKHETGCDIKVLERSAESDDRVIVISGPAVWDEGICAPQDAVLRVQTRIYRAAPTAAEVKGVTAKVIVSAHQIGCILGKGGAVISEMRKSTGAFIRILGKDQTPQYAAENEEVVQINGEFDAVQEALLQITTRLRNHYFRDAFPSMGMGMGRREVSPPGRYSSFNRFDGGFHDPYMHHDRPPFPISAPWGIEEFGQRRMGGFGGYGQPHPHPHQAIITNTTVEVVVPRSVVPCIYGEDGGCLNQIRQISDAKITITDPKPAAKETLIIISGTPEQAHAAQSLIQAFVISETQAS